MQMLMDPPDQTGTDLKHDNDLKSRFTLDNFFRLLYAYRLAKASLARGEKSIGLRILYILRTHLNQLSTENMDIVRLRSSVNADAAAWGFGFDWD